MTSGVHIYVIRLFCYVGFFFVFQVHVQTSRLMVVRPQKTQRNSLLPVGFIPVQAVEYLRTMEGSMCVLHNTVKVLNQIRQLFLTVVNRCKSWLCLNK